MMFVSVVHRVAVLLAAAGVAAAAAAGGSPDAVAAPVAAVCQGTDLSVGQNRDGFQEGMLHRGVDIVVTNSSHVACTLDGYLGLRLLSADQRPLATQVTRGDTFFETDPGPHLITVQPGQQLAADLAWSHPSAPSDPQVSPAYLQVTTPGATDGSFTIPFRVGPVYRAAVATTALSPFTGPRP